MESCVKMGKTARIDLEKSGSMYMVAHPRATEGNKTYLVGAVSHIGSIGVKQRLAIIQNWARRRG